MYTIEESWQQTSLAKSDIQEAIKDSYRLAFFLGFGAMLMELKEIQWLNDDAYVAQLTVLSDEFLEFSKEFMASLPTAGG